MCVLQYILIIWLCMFLFYFFFFKQKTAYDMRISDWSSDVCSSDLIGREACTESPAQRSREVLRPRTARSVRLQLTIVPRDKTPAPPHHSRPASMPHRQADSPSVHRRPSAFRSLHSETLQPNLQSFVPRRRPQWQDYRASAPSARERADRERACHRTTDTGSPWVSRLPKQYPAHPLRRTHHHKNQAPPQP